VAVLCWSLECLPLGPLVFFVFTLELLLRALQALLQLSQIGLQFDESKSQNPFAYYTAAITNSFTRILNIEKKNQNIRDDILEMNGLNPSWTRQNSGKAGMAAMSGPVTTTYEE
jgi:hypothetical protein